MLILSLPTGPVNVYEMSINKLKESKEGKTESWKMEKKSEKGDYMRRLIPEKHTTEERWEAIAWYIK